MWFFFRPSPNRNYMCPKTLWTFIAQITRSITYFTKFVLPNNKIRGYLRQHWYHTCRGVLRPKITNMFPNCTHRLNKISKFPKSEQCQRKCSGVSINWTGLYSKFKIQYKIPVNLKIFRTHNFINRNVFQLHVRALF